MRSVRHRSLPVALMLAAAVGLTVPAAADPAPAHASKPNHFALYEDTSTRTADGLDKKLYRDTVPTVLKRANRRAKAGCHVGALNHVRTTWSYCFDKVDAVTMKWIPQGVTGVSDARVDESWQGTKPLVVSWYQHTHCKRACETRVSFLDSKTGHYRHALLVEPTTNSAHHYSYRRVSVHAGGIAWYGNYLYLADTYYGLRVFDVRKIFDLDPDGKPSTDDRQQDRDVRSNVTNLAKVGRYDNVFYGGGYRYVLPQVHQYSHLPAGTCGVGWSRVSYVSIDRSTRPDSLITGEYCTGKRPHHGRVARYPLDHRTGLPKTHQDVVDRVATPTTVRQLPDWYVQGATSYRGRWYLNRSHNCKKNSMGTLIEALPKGSHGMNVVYERPVATGPEDLSVWRGRNDLVSVSEHSPKEAEHGPQKQRCIKSHTGRAIYAVHR